MALRTTDNAGQVNDQIHRLAGFLAEMTGGQNATQVHAAIRGQLSAPKCDQRIAGVADLDEFRGLWSALTEHAMVADVAWEKVVLPTILVFSDDKALKANLEWATSHWLAIADAERTVLLTPPAASAGGTAMLTWHDVEGSTVPVKSMPQSAVTAPAKGSRSGLDRRSKLAIVAAGTILGIVAGAMAWQLAAREANTVRATDPGQALSAAPVPATTAAEVAPPLAATAPAPAPTWTGPAPMVAPQPPQQVFVTGVTGRSAALRWDLPLVGAGATIAYYRILRDGADVGWTTHTSVTIAGLEPGVRYEFTVVAYDSAGAASAPSATVWAATPAVAAAGAPTVATTLDAPIALGESISVIGDRWSCGSPAQVSISLGGHRVATAPVSAEGMFTATIAFEVFDKGRPQLVVSGTGERLELSPGSLVLAAELIGQPQCGLHNAATTQIVLR